MPFQKGSPRLAVVRTGTGLEIIKTLKYEGARPIKILVNSVHPTDDFT